MTDVRFFCFAKPSAVVPSSFCKFTSAPCFSNSLSFTHVEKEGSEPLDRISRLTGFTDFKAKRVPCLKTCNPEILSQTTCREWVRRRGSESVHRDSCGCAFPSKDKQVLQA